MGRRTWEGIPAKNRPLKGRLNVVLSRARPADLPSEVMHATSLDGALALLARLNTSNALDLTGEKSIESAVVIGGVSLFEETAAHTQVGQGSRACS